MSHFSQDYLNFFKELAANNNKDWFDQNRKRYLHNVKEPFQSFIQDLIDEIRQIDPEIELEPKDAIFRINRDIRFSKDKTPYKLNNSAIISKYGRKDKSYGGLYLELGPEKVGIYGGIYMPDAQQIKLIRDQISRNLSSFDQLIYEKKFVNKYNQIRGEKNIKVPREFKEIVEQQPLILNKQWYYFAELPSETVYGAGLIELILEYYKAGKPVQDFFNNALTT